MTETFGESSRGLIFECSPYCSFLGQKEGSKYSPSLENLQVDHKKLKFVDQFDPLYPLLKPVTPASSTGGKSEGIGNRKKGHSDDRTSDSMPPQYAKVPYDFGWSIQSGPIVISEKVESDTEIQKSISAKSAQVMWFARADLAKGKALSFFQNWFRIHGYYQVAQGLSYPVEEPGLKIERSQSELAVYLWWLKEHFQLAPAFILKTEKRASSPDSIGHYSFNRSDQVLRLSYKYLKRWVVEFDHLLSSSYSDSQSFRSGSFNIQSEKISLTYCSRDISLFDIQFGLCGSGGYLAENQSSGLNPSYISGGESNIKSNSFSLGLSVRMGEDFNQ